MAVGDAGIYLTEPPQCIPWPEVAELVVFRTWQDGDDADSRKWLSQMAVVPSGEDFQHGAGARRLSILDQCGVTVDLHDEKVRLGELSDAVHTYAPGLPVSDAGKIKNKNAGSRAANRRHSVAQEGGVGGTSSASGNVRPSWRYALGLRSPTRSCCQNGSA